MAGKFTEKVKEVRKRLFSLFCLCSAGTPVAGEGEDERLRFVVEPRRVDSSGQPWAASVRGALLPEMPQSPYQTGDDKVPHPQLGLTRDVTRVVEKKVPRQHVPAQPAPHQTQDEPMIVVTKSGSMRSEILALVDHMARVASPSAIQEVHAISEFVKKTLSLSGTELPLFEPSFDGPYYNYFYTNHISADPEPVIVPSQPALVSGPIFEPHPICSWSCVSG